MSIPNKVIVSARPNDPDIPTYVVGVNEHRHVADGAPDIGSNVVLWVFSLVNLHNASR